LRLDFIPILIALLLAMPNNLRGDFKIADTASTRPADATGAVGVVDLDKVADAVGWAATIATDNATAMESLRREYGEAIKLADEEIRRHKQELVRSAKLTLEQANDLMNDTNLDKLPLGKAERDKLFAAMHNLSQYRQLAEGAVSRALQSRRIEVLMLYRRAVQPIVRAVAVKRGFTMVVTKQDNIFYYAESIDLTNAVIEAIDSDPPKVVLPPAPRLQLPPVPAIAP
jgi:Skp family chaperone for outer membrane proteins